MSDLEKKLYGSDAPVTNKETKILTEEMVKVPGHGEKTEVILDIPSKNIGKYAYGAKTGKAGVLTGGEINDFGKIKMWQDLVEHELSTYRNHWQMFPQGRMLVQVISENGIPIASAKVELINAAGKIVYRALSDNTGKAELWTQIGNQNLATENNLQVKVSYQGIKQNINQLKFAEQGLNTVRIRTKCEQSANVDIAFVVDATGSMGDEIDFLKKDLNEIIFQSKQINSALNFRFAQVFYRDRGEDYLVKQLDFTRILSESTDFVSTQEAEGGGDYEEAVEVALDSAINHLNWSTEARARILFLVLDAPPHNTPENRLKIEKLMRQAAEKGIRIVPIAASGINKATEYLMRVMALSTNGTYLFLTDNSNIGAKHIAPSTDEFTVETMNKMITRIITSYIYMPDCQQEIPNVNLDYPDSLVDVPQLKDSLSDSLSQVNTNFSWSYYPNPSFGIVNIKANRDITELYLTDLSGKILQVIKDLKANEISRIDLSNYASGIYLIRYPQGNNFISGKLVLVRDS